MSVRNTCDGTVIVSVMAGTVPTSSGASTRPRCSRRSGDVGRAGSRAALRTKRNLGRSQMPLRSGGWVSSLSVSGSLRPVVRGWDTSHDLVSDGRVQPKFTRSLGDVACSGVGSGGRHGLAVLALGSLLRHPEHGTDL